MKCALDRSAEALRLLADTARLRRLGTATPAEQRVTISGAGNRASPREGRQSSLAHGAAR